MQLRSSCNDVRYHRFMIFYTYNLLQLEKIHNDDNGANMMTKYLSKDKHEKC